ncbi:tyrosine-type recombinase/integrase [Marinobacterium lutimaris]|uniref:Integrase n=1 Tax=Marinobacterium lutimaris TaxID=568106 RepID=A0A1H6AKT1_9GAMM|nr:integrase arm-type DNA-binding domain-containing protein [Marinobacterium lutimaris]SEG49343.1 Integrase [Marinobacterium lutimaris]
MPLTDKQAKAAAPAEKDYKLADEKGLFLLVKRNGAKYWRMKYRFAGKEKLLSIGVYPETSLKAARTKRDEARQLLAEGTDPSVAKRARKQATITAALNSFEAIALEWHQLKSAGWAQSNADKIKGRMEKYLFPVIGSRPIDSIEAPELLTLIRKIEAKEHYETAHRVRSYASKVFKYAIATGRASRDPAGDLVGTLKPKQTKHYAAITTPQEFGRLLLAIDNYQGTPAVIAALKCSALWFCRPGELRQTEWAEVDFDNQMIVIPGDRMKMRNDHIIPLSRQSIEILRELEPLTRRSKYVFPGVRGASRPLSENGVRTALLNMGYDNNTHTAHGFRATARTLLDEVLGYRFEWIEQQLAHEVRDTNGRAYNRTQHLEQRREMMQRWADYLDQLKTAAAAGNVISASFGGRAG